ncbi:MAG: hypothetical protein IJA58_05575, partial [Lachnospiraceae bacterium]|nr:hypothetical protein [Lachnospiraceae bacterium]
MIKLILSEENFEYDIRGLLMAFFPGEEITTKPDVTADRTLGVVYEGDMIRLSFCGCADAPVQELSVSATEDPGPEAAKQKESDLR